MKFNGKRLLLLTLCLFFSSTIVVHAQTYCPSKSNYTSRGGIVRVVLNNLDNSSALSTYQNFAALVTPVYLQQGMTAMFQLYPGFSTAKTYNENWKVFIDFNRNGVFTDAGEEIAAGTTSGKNPLIGSFTIPINASVGETRMRIAMSQNSIPSSCRSFAYGEVEDYKVVMGVQEVATTPVVCPRGSANIGYVVLAPDKESKKPEQVSVVDSFSGVVLSKFFAYESNYRNGTRIAVADIDNDGMEEIVTIPGRNHDMFVRVFTLNGEAKPRYEQFVAYDKAGINSGGAMIDVADVNNDCLPDIITVPTYGNIDVRVFFQQSDPAKPAFQSVPDISFRAFSVAPMGGGGVVAADMGRMLSNSFVNVPDGKAEIIVNTGDGVKATVAVYNISATTPILVQTFNPFATAYTNRDFKGGVNLSLAQIKENAPPAIIAGQGTTGVSRVEIWEWNTSDNELYLSGVIPNAFTGETQSQAVRVSGVDIKGNGLANYIYAVQGPVRISSEMHIFKITGTSPFQYKEFSPFEPYELVDNVHKTIYGPWFIGGPQLTGNPF